MALILDPSQHSTDRLRSLLLEEREGISEYLEMLQNPPKPARDPMSLRTTVELLTDALAAIDRLDTPTADAGTLAAATNLGHSAMLAAIDLWKSHADVPRVPKGPTPPPA